MWKRIIKSNVKYMVVMKNETKLKKVIEFLKENNINYIECKKRYGHSDVFLPDTRVAIKVDGEDRYHFYKTHKRRSYPVFIRDEDTLKFVLEKIQNTIVKSMLKEQELLMCKKQKEENRRINAEQMKLRAERKAAKARKATKETAEKGGKYGRRI